MNAMLRTLELPSAMPASDDAAIRAAVEQACRQVAPLVAFLTRALGWRW